eukprot:TRINITY_DN2730_c0_g3_i3.p1 TRINITY_DN2730_c0_g3~~TRINITY_DN2730_c0_g3_i3.p1  ORF type:complete len:577 (+),score=222.12 TRINITY_DN2730_c0_g3_i3:248-1732(+)
MNGEGRIEDRLPKRVSFRNVIDVADGETKGVSPLQTRQKEHETEKTKLQPVDDLFEAERKHSEDDAGINECKVEKQRVKEEIDGQREGGQQDVHDDDDDEDDDDDDDDEIGALPDFEVQVVETGPLEKEVASKKGHSKSMMMQCPLCGLLVQTSELEEHVNKELDGIEKEFHDPTAENVDVEESHVERSSSPIEVYDEGNVSDVMINEGGDDGDEIEEILDDSSTCTGRDLEDANGLLELDDDEIEECVDFDLRQASGPSTSKRGRSVSRGRKRGTRKYSRTPQKMMKLVDSCEQDVDGEASVEKKRKGCGKRQMRRKANTRHVGRKSKSGTDEKTTECESGESGASWFYHSGRLHYKSKSGRVLSGPAAYRASKIDKGETPPEPKGKRGRGRRGRGNAQDDGERRRRESQMEILSELRRNPQASESGRERESDEFLRMYNEPHSAFDILRRTRVSDDHDDGVDDPEGTTGQRMHGGWEVSGGGSTWHIGGNLS